MNDGAAADTAAVDTAAAAIRAIDLVKAFGELRAVDGVSLELAPGRIYGLLGPNGSGKTTLIRLLLGLAQATSGRAEVLGVAMPSRPMLARIGYMTQADGVYPALTVGENARFFAATYGVRDPGAVEAALRIVELDDRSSSITATLSGSQRRRLSLACALVHQPPVLFLDEPTVGLAPAGARQLKNILRRLCSEGRTVFLSTHVLEVAELLCDRVGVVQRGRLLTVGTPAELRAVGGDESLEEAFLRITGAGGDTDLRPLLRALDA